MIKRLSYCLEITRSNLSNAKAICVRSQETKIDHVIWVRGMALLAIVAVCELSYAEEGREQFSPSVLCDLVMQHEKQFIRMHRFLSGF